MAFAQFLAEKMCERRARAMKTSLPKYFWNTLPAWKGYYFYQLKLARILVTRYNEHAIWKAMIELDYVYSLKTIKFVDLVKKYDGETVVEHDVILEPLPESKGNFHRPKGKLSRLDD